MQRPTTTITMPCIPRLTRRYYGSTQSYDPSKTPIIIGIVSVVVFTVIVTVTLYRCSMRAKSTSPTPSNRESDLARAQRQRSQYNGWMHDRPLPPRPESDLARAQRQRRENNGWWGAEPARVETAAERRRRNLQVRANRNAESGIEREARREVEATEGQDALPKYQRPTPAYYANPEWRRQHLTGRRELVHPPPPQEFDAPPAYDSPAVWPTGVRVP